LDMVVKRKDPIIAPVVLTEQQNIQNLKIYRLTNNQNEAVTGNTGALTHGGSSDFLIQQFCIRQPLGFSSFMVAVSVYGIVFCLFQ